MIMYISKKIKRVILASLTVSSLTLLPMINSNSVDGIDDNVKVPVVSTASAEVTNYTGVGKYVMNDFEQSETVKQRAKQKAIAHAKDQAVVYIESYASSINARLTEDEIFTIINNEIEVVDVQYENVSDEQEGKNNGISQATVTVSIDTDSILNWLKRDYQDRMNLINQDRAIQQYIDENNEQVEKLKQQYDAATTDEERSAIKSEFDQNDNNFLMIQKLEEGSKLYYQQDYASTAEFFTSIIKTNADSYWSYINRGNAYIKLNKYDDALNDYNSAIKLNPNLAMAYLERGIFYATVKKDYNQAIFDFDKSLKMNYYFAEAYLYRGLAYAETKNYRQAVSNYNKAIAINPDYAEGYNNRGLIYRQLKQYDKAIVDLNKAIEINPNIAEAYNNRGVAYDELKKRDEALSDYSKAIELNSDYEWAYINRGTIYAETEHYDEAIADYAKAIELNPNNAVIYSNRGRAYALLKNYDAAIADFTKVIEFNPDNAQAYYRRGMCYKKLGDTARAEADIAKAKELGFNG